MCVCVRACVGDVVWKWFIGDFGNLNTVLYLWLMQDVMVALSSPHSSFWTGVNSDRFIDLPIILSNHLSCILILSHICHFNQN